MCFVCGLKNSFGLHSSFYELENGELMSVFSPGEEHQGYPGRLHGGIAATILDETIGRAIMLDHSDEFWGVTIEFSAKYRKPIPLDSEVRVITRVIKDSGRVFEGTGEIILDDGAIAVEGKGKYIKLPISRISDFNAEEQEWKVVDSPDDPDHISIG